jgi:hypothetical protein
MFGPYAHTRILYTYGDTTRNAAPVFECARPAPDNDCAHGFHGVDDEIQYHVLQQDPINNYRTKL